MVMLYVIKGTDVDIPALSFVLIAIITFIGWELLTSNAVRPLLPRWLRRRLAKSAKVKTR
jgi:hypothetical protein